MSYFVTNHFGVINKYQPKLKQIISYNKILFKSIFYLFLIFSIN